MIAYVNTSWLQNFDGAHLQRFRNSSLSKAFGQTAQMPLPPLFGRT